MILKRLIMGSFILFITACSVTKPNISSSQYNFTHSKPQTAAADSELVIATWNTEHLAFPIYDGCRPRNKDEIAKLRGYAKSLNADIVALQEIASIEAAELLFPKNEWNIILSTRPNSEPYTCRKSGAASTQQKIAFAVRDGINILKINYLEEFGLDLPGLRYGLELTVDSPLGPIVFLNVHMKSGCFVDNYSRENSDACKTFSNQTPLLKSWQEEKEQLGNPYIILGDFNHRLSAPYNHLTRQLSNTSNNEYSSLENVGAHLIGCHPYYPAPIDHILLGNMPKKGLNKIVKIHQFDDMAPDAMLSDHCALSLQLSHEDFPVSNAVKW